MLNQLIWPKGKLVNRFSSEITSVDEFLSKYDNVVGVLPKKEFDGTNFPCTRLHEISGENMHERESHFSVYNEVKKECNIGTPFAHTQEIVQPPLGTSTCGLLVPRFHRGAQLLTSVGEVECGDETSEEVSEGIGPAQVSGNFMDMLAPLEENLHAHRWEVNSLTQHENFICEGSKVHEDFFDEGLHIIIGLPLGMRITKIDFGLYEI